MNMKMEGNNGAFTPPVFSHTWRVRTRPESNEKGSWRGLHIELAEQVEAVEVYNTAKLFYQQVSEGTVRVAAPPQDAPASGGGDEF